MRSQLPARSRALCTTIGAVNVGRTSLVQSTGAWRAESDDDLMLAAGS
jgi:hypothetical protein